MNLPNKLTILRILLTFIFIAFLFVNLPFARTIALGIFILASLTDLFDGYIARRYGLITNLGKLLDPIADKILTLSAFLAFVQLGLIKAWMVIIIILREFIITGLRLLALSNGKVLEATLAGKHKTVSQMVAIVFILVYLSLLEFIKNIPTANFKTVIDIIMYITIVLTIISGISYLIRNKDIIKNYGR